MYIYLYVYIYTHIQQPHGRFQDKCQCITATHCNTQLDTATEPDLYTCDMTYVSLHGRSQGRHHLETTRPQRD